MPTTAGAQRRAVAEGQRREQRRERWREAALLIASRPLAMRERERRAATGREEGGGSGRLGVGSDKMGDEEGEKKKREERRKKRGIFRDFSSGATLG